MTGKDISIRQELAALYRLLDIYKMSDYFFWIISGIAIGLIIYLGDKYIF